MKESQIIDLVCSKLKPVGIYLCPQELTSHLRSPDIHVLAIVEGKMVADFHYLPVVARTPTRIEVSAVGCQIIEHEISNGISTWLGFFTIAKLTTAKPLFEDKNCSEIRQLAIQRAQIKPSLIASMIKTIRDIVDGMKRRCILNTFLVSNALLLATFSAIMAIRLGKTFLKTSDLLTDMPKAYVSSLQGLEIKRETQESALGKLLNARDFLNRLFGSIEIDHSRLIGQEWQQEG